jgi:hypothetical protein
MPVVKILIFPDIDSDLDKKFSFSFGHYLCGNLYFIEIWNLMIY